LLEGAHRFAALENFAKLHGYVLRLLTAGC
jgi:hypothetical protein